MNRWLPFEWIAAVRFLREGRLQTLFIIGGIAIGVGVIVFMSAMLAGLEANFIKRVLTSQPQIQLLSPDQVARPLRNSPGVIEDAIVQRPSQRVISIDQWPKIRAQMLAMPEITAVSPTISGSALAIRGDASRAVTLSGIEPESYFTIVRVPDYIVAGEPRLTSEDIIIGIELAKDLGAVVGDKLNVQAASGANRVLTVTGLVDLGNKGVNQRAAYVALRTAQSLLGMVGGVTTIDITVQDIYAAEDIAQRIQAANLVKADSWIKTNAQFFVAVRAQETSNTLIRVFVAMSVAFGIAAVLIVSVIQRSKEIGILRAMGTSRGQILRVFLLQGGLLGFIGSLFGAALGAGALIYWHAVQRQTDGSELFPLILERRLFVITALLATVTGLLAATAPALRAAKLDPVVAIRG
ncbi:putative ABC transporter, permease protein; lipoprotein-releasing system transmembrane protein lolC [Bradyrhizobium sp. ORS 285]|uniref:ABC transporter permease n=1 Tax=Bradyrhizobium sp. ORS 285 TaxID=115808 RepID=UPI0002408F3D|nr:FtsX-like permease family protein [Bradyrhizobium sp. ORS 285]CCD86294.1 putative ABC transporter, permease protein; lipoprotein-releasing system transmembrane protein lolC [Bradyrhizobium sp. ORS 285]SMX60677.1 putative ABC transporter, permease protein; lipoprotein-releasing system transmembrane protein lolC [Bradyrhizobium sp. ORS 285]